MATMNSADVTFPGASASRTPAKAASDTVGVLLRELQELAVRLRTFQTSGETSKQESVAVRNVLQTLSSSGPQSVPQIAQGRSTSRQNIQVMVNRLARTGCVELTANPRHRRSPLLRLTERGKALLEDLNGTDGEVGRLLDNQLETEDVQTALSVVRRILGLLAKPDRNGHQAEAKPAITGTVERERAKRGRKPTHTVRPRPVAAETFLEPGNDLPVALL